MEATQGYCIKWKSQVEKDKYHIFCHLWILDDT